jgi:protein gp37
VSGKTRIEWTNATWNPVTGCDAVSPGCDHCYARAMARRFAGRAGYPAAPHEFDVTLHPERLDEPLRWRKPRRVFVVSMGDLFHEQVPDEFIDRVWFSMASCPQHTFQVLTKRPARMLECLSRFQTRTGMKWRYFKCQRCGSVFEDYACQCPETGMELCQNCYRKLGEAASYLMDPIPGWPLPHVWLGVTAEDQQRADERVPLLLQVPAAVRFVSCEPLLGPVDLTACREQGVVDVDALAGTHGVVRPHGGTNAKLDWVICGGETGVQARAMHPDWARSLRDQCQAAGVPFFFKSHSQDNSPRLGQSMDAARVAHTLDGVEHHTFPEVAQ